MNDTKERVLIVDDSESRRYVIGVWLRRADYEIVEATTGHDALKIVETEAIDLVVLDVNLPDISGYVVCEQIKGDLRTASIPVLHISATATDSSQRSEGLRRGADGYLVEPIEREELLASVEALLRSAAAQRTAVRLAWRLRRLNDATLAVNEAASFEQLVATIASEACHLFDVAATAALIVDDVGVSALADENCKPELTLGTPEIVDQIRRSAGTRLAAELSGERGQSGILLLDVPEADEFNDGDETEVVLTQYARSATNAIKNMRSYDVERRIALTLQRSLLPGVLSKIPGLDVAVRYEASAEHAEVGGDFYELFPLDADRVAFAIGDVVGHSLEAATVMAELRTGIRSYILEGHSSSATIDRLNRLLGRFHPELTATVCCAIFNRRTGRCEITNAGHPPPLLISGNDVSFLPYGGALLGLDVPAAAPHVFTLRSNDVLVLYTDGLIERRDEAIDASMRRLAGAARALPRGDLDTFCDRLLRDAGPPTRTDDIALVALRPHDRPESALA